MPFLRFSRDKRGYENFYLVQPTTNRRGRVRARVLYFYRTPPDVKVGREPFDPAVRRALETQNPDVAFDWRQILETPIPSAETERWRERRRQERAERAVRQAAAAVEDVEDVEEDEQAGADADSRGLDTPPNVDATAPVDDATPPNVEEADLGAEPMTSAAESPDVVGAPSGAPIATPSPTLVSVGSGAGSEAGARRRRRRRRGRRGRTPFPGPTQPPSPGMLSTGPAGDADAPGAQQSAGVPVSDVSDVSDVSQVGEVSPVREVGEVSPVGDVGDAAVKE
jgi:hypothetical protein